MWMKKWKLTRKFRDYCEVTATEMKGTYCIVISPVAQGLEEATIL